MDKIALVVFVGVFHRIVFVCFELVLYHIEAALYFYLQMVLCLEGRSLVRILVLQRFQPFRVILRGRNSNDVDEKFQHSSGS